jgi:hypothetical protein
MTEQWPHLDLHDWQETYAGLHLRTQMLGKTRLALSPSENHWWHTVLYVTSRGLTTSPMPSGERTVELELDLFAHELMLRTSEGIVRALPLRPQTISEFYREYTAMLEAEDIDARIWGTPVEIPGPIPFEDDDVHAAYDADAVSRCFHALVQVDRVLKQFRGEFVGKCSPVHFWWGAFDIACTRFSGRRAPQHPGGVPNLSDAVVREAYSHECISAGWWPGTIGGPLEEAAFYVYAYPEPPGCPEAQIWPADASYHQTLREWVLPYEAVRTAADPDAMLLEFLHSTYDAAARLGGWSDDLRRSVVPISP